MQAKTFFSIFPRRAAGIADAFADWEVISGVWKQLPEDDRTLRPEGCHQVRYHIMSGGVPIINSCTLSDLKRQLAGLKPWKSRRGANPATAEVNMAQADQLASQQVWSYLRGQVQNGVLLAIFRALLDRDLKTLEQISKALFSHHAGVSEVTAISCNQALQALGLFEALRVCVGGVIDSRVDHNNLILFAPAHNVNVRLNLRPEDVDSGKRTASYATRGLGQTLPDKAVGDLRQVLIAAVGQKLTHYLCRVS